VEWIERKPQLRTPDNPIIPITCAGDVRLVDVRFRYKLRPERLVLDGLSLHAPPGEVVALCGPSGGGKSSCIQLLEGFYRPESGSVLLDGVPVHEIEPHWFHQKVSLVAQEPVLFARSIRENILYGVDETQPVEEGAVERAAALASADDFIASFDLGYDTHVGERGAQLSGGQKQRIAIARALVRRPSVLLLDEATSALDAESEQAVQVAIDGLIVAGGMTVIVIAHRLSTIRAADAIYLVKGGRVVEKGNHEELMQIRGEYFKLVQRQLEPAAGSANGLSKKCNGNLTQLAGTSNGHVS